ncbi:MAG: SDR family NAD(P)-dependent oxidoreductase [Streptosporangiaceae bacterium]|jgi:NAD(P)-dependent dehydrogenase (short-subunit alcohol dehydrogenase family)
MSESLLHEPDRIDVLFANAGSSNAPELWATSDEQFDQVISANLKSTFFTVTSTAGALIDGASEILTSSVGWQRGTLGDPLYAAAKAADRALGRGFAADPRLLRRRIRVNTISFGAVRTPMTGASDPQMRDALDEWAAQNVPMARWADVGEAAAAVLFLASGASSYMTGAELATDGGLAQL